MKRAEVSHYFFIYGAIVVVLFLLAAYTSLDQLFDFTEPKRIVTLDSLEVLMESMDVHRGTYISGYFSVQEPVRFTNRDGVRMLNTSGTERQLVLRSQVDPESFEIVATNRIEATVDPSGSKIGYRLMPEPSCDAQAHTLEDIPDGFAEILPKREGSLDSPETIVILASTPEAYCEVIGLSENYRVQAFVSGPEPVARFTDKEVFIVVV